MRYPCLLLAFTLFASSAFALRPIDLRQREGRFSKRTFDINKAPLKKESTGLINDRFSIRDWSKRYSPIGNRRSSVAIEEQQEKVSLSKRLYERELARVSTEDTSAITRDDTSLFETQFGHRFGSRRARQITEKPVRQELDLGIHSYYILAEEISMREINRFQFRSSRKDESLQRVRAGEEE